MKNFKNKNNNIMQNGNALIFFVLFVLPILSFLLMLTFDVATIYTSKRKVQDVLDEASLQGVKFFPYKNYAINVAKNYLNSNGLEDDNLTVVATSEGINISYNKNYELVFSRLADTFFNAHANLSWPVRVSSFSTPAIGDYFLLLDRNFYNSPDDESLLWGNDGEWPSALYFNMNNTQYQNPRYYTQQCFNEAFSPVKQMLIDTYNFLEGFSLNSIGVGVFPGVAYKRDVDLIREIKKVNKNEPVNFLQYAGIDGTTTQGCYNASLEENQEEKYKAPTRNELYFNNDNEKKIDDSHFVFANSFWSIPVHKGYFSNFENVLDSAIKHILSSGTISDRYTTSSNIEKTIFIFSTAVPSINKIFFPNNNLKATLINKIKELDIIAKQQDIKVNIVYVLYESNKVDDVVLNDIKAFKNYFNNGVFQAQSFNFYFITDSNIEDLQNKLMTFLQLHKKEGSIWR